MSLVISSVPRHLNQRLLTLLASMNTIASMRVRCRHTLEQIQSGCGEPGY